MPCKALLSKRLQVLAPVIIKRKLNLKIAYSYRLIFYARFRAVIFLDHLLKHAEQYQRCMPFKVWRTATI